MSDLLKQNLDVQFTFHPQQRKVNQSTDSDGLKVRANGTRSGIVARTKMYIRVRVEVPVMENNKQKFENGIPVTETQLIPLFNGVGGTIWGTFAPKDDNVKRPRVLSINADFSNQQTAASGYKYALTPMDNEFESWAKKEMEAQFKAHKFSRTDEDFDSNVTVLSDMADALMDCALEEFVAPEQAPHIADSQSTMDQLANQQNNGLQEPTV